MDTPAVIAGIGGIAILIALIGGGITAKEVVIPSLPRNIRIVLGLVGFALIGISIWLTTQKPKTPSTTQTPDTTQIFATKITLPTIVISAVTSPVTSISPTAAPTIEIRNSIVLWSNYWSQGDGGLDAYTTGWRGYRNLIRDVAWVTNGDGEFEGEKVLKISVRDDLLPENLEKYEDGSGTTEPGYFELDWHHYIQPSGFNLTPNQDFSPPLKLPFGYESSFVIGDDFRRVNTNDSNPMRFDFKNGEFNLLSLFDTIDENGLWYLMVNVNLEGTLDKLYPTILSSGDVRGDPQTNIGDVYLSQLTQYGQEHPLRANKRYWYQVLVTSNREIIVSFRDTKDSRYYVYLKGSLSNAINPHVVSFRGPLAVNWSSLRPEFRLISGTFIRGSEIIFTWSE